MLQLVLSDPGVTVSAMVGPSPPRYTHPTMLPDPDACIELGRAVVADGRLKALRERLGVSRGAMAELLYTNTITYARWERQPQMNLQRSTAERVGRFYHAALDQLEVLEHEGHSPADYVSLGVAAMQLGVAQEVLFQWYRQDRLKALDAGLLGLWVHRSDLASLRGRR